MAKNKTYGYALVMETISKFRINAPPHNSYATVSANFLYR